MNKCKYATSRLVISTLLAASPICAAEPPQLNNNPFSRPPSEVTIPDQRSAGFDGPLQEIDLRATIVSTKSRFANVAGRTLQPGEEVQGYTLLQVFEDRAVFSGHGKKITVYVKPDVEEDNERERRR